jgi:hypothetical protein
VGRALVAAVLFALALGAASAQERPGGGAAGQAVPPGNPPSPPQGEKKPPATPEKPPEFQERLPPGRSVIQSADGVTWDAPDGFSITYLTGGVVIRRPDLQLKCGQALVWSKKGEAETFQQVYAEGNVELHREGQVLRCEKLYIDQSDPEHPRAVIIDMRAETMSRGFQEKFYVRAEEAHQVAKGKLQAHNISLTTCNYGVPHYHMSIEDGTFVGVDEKPPMGKLDLFPYKSWELEGVENYAELMGAPFAFLPSMTLSPSAEQFPLRRIEAGHSSAWGYYGLSLWGLKIPQTDDQGKIRPWADLQLEADYRELRGFGYGINTIYKWTNYDGYLKTYYMDDLGRDPSLGFNSKFGPLLHDERGFAHLYHRQELSEHWRLELESYYVPDRNIREEFFTKEFYEDKDPETAAYLRWEDGPLGGFLYERYRLNHWDTQTEYLPRVNLSAFQIPVARGALADLYVSQRVDGGLLREVFDNSERLPSEQTWRVDSTTEISLPIDCRYFQVAPFAMERLTYYSNDVAGTDALRSIPALGARVSAQAYQTWPDLGWELVGLRGLRHIIEFEMAYAAAYNHSVQPNELFQMDSVDALTSFEEVEFGLHQRFKTRDESGKPFEFLSVGIEVEYYPNPQRDTTSVLAQDYLPPFNYIMVNPQSDGTTPARHWSNLHYGMTFQPRKFFQISAEGEYNPSRGVEEIREIGLTVWPWEHASLSLGQTFVRGLTNAYSAAVTTALTEKWTVSAQLQYDVHLDQFLTQRFVVSRDFHDFQLEGVFERNTSTNDRRAYVAFVPKFLGQKGERHSHVSNPILGAPQFTNPQP